MARELWTSPITGYRRKGTRLAELRSTLSGITARAILEPLQSCPADASATEIAAELRRRDFDVAGVKAKETGPVIGFVEAASLNGGAVGDFVRDLTADCLVAEGIPLPGLLAFLESRRRAFVLIGSDVAGIVTRADLGKPAVRVYLFGLISLLEMHIGFWVRRAYPQESWQRELSDGRVTAANRILEERRKRNEEVGLFECLQFCDKRDLFLREEGLLARLEIGDRPEALDRLRRAESLRDHLAHSQDDLVHGTSWEAVIGLVQWIEKALETSDGSIERDAANASQRKEASDLLASA